MTITLFRNVWRSFWGQRARSLLIVFSLAVGIFAVGTTAGAQNILGGEMRSSMQAVNAAHILVNVSGMDATQLAALRQSPDIARIEGRASLSIRAAVGNGQGGSDWRNLNLYTAPQESAWGVDAILPQQGEWPPASTSVVLERGTLAYLNIQPGGSLRLQTPQGQVLELPVTGVGHDLYQVNPVITAAGAGYISAETLRQLGGPQGYTQLHIQLRPASLADAQASAGRIRQTLESAGVSIQAVDIYANGDHPLAGLVQGLSLVLGLMGGLALLLAGFLVVNTINALLIEQTRQIGILKAIGARRGQVLTFYLAQVAWLGMVALLLAIPLGIWGARALAGLIAGLINLDLGRSVQPLWVMALQAGLGLLVPLGAALIPVLSAARRTVHSALNDYGLGDAAFGQGWLDRLSGALARGPLALRMAFRNALRRKQRLAFTVITLGLASAIAISVFGVQSATRQTRDDLRSFFRHDLFIQFSNPVDAAQMLDIVRQDPQVTTAEAWIIASAYSTLDATAEPIALWAGPADSVMLHPKLLAGRWLQPGDEVAIVVDSHLTGDYPALRVGDRLPLTIHGRAQEWTVVGIFQTVPNNLRPTAVAYVPYEAYTTLIGTPGQANQVWVQGTGHSAAAQSQLITDLDQRLKAAGLASERAVTGEELNTAFATAFNLIITFLLAMSGLLGFVGGLGLMGMIGLNVLERRRELGMLRAVGARRWVITASLAAESVFVALLAWGLGVLLALPLSAGMCWLVGKALLNSPFLYSFSAGGALLWLAVIMGLAVLASLLPARRALRASVVETLMYE
jgi:putative ABC transport system permease protein